MKTKLALLLAQWLISYIKKHPEFLYKLGDLIPGQLDDEALHKLVELLNAK